MEQGSLIYPQNWGDRHSRRKAQDFQVMQWNKNINKYPKIYFTTEVISLEKDYSIAYDFATSAYKKFQQIIKSIVLFGSVAKDKKKIIISISFGFFLSFA